MNLDDAVSAIESAHGVPLGIMWYHPDTNKLYLATFTDQKKEEVEAILEGVATGLGIAIDE